MCLLIETKAELRRLVMPEEEEEESKRASKRKARGAQGWKHQK